MAISFSGTAKEITLTSDTTFLWTDIYNAARAWEDGATEMQYHHPLDASAELLFTLRYGWVLKPSGYPSGTTIVVDGKINTIPLDEEKTTPATTGEQVTWQFDTPATAVIVSVASETVNVWNEPPTAAAIRAEIDDNSQVAKDAKQAKLNTF